MSFCGIGGACRVRCGGISRKDGFLNGASYTTSTTACPRTSIFEERRGCERSTEEEEEDEYSGAISTLSSALDVNSEAFSSCKSNPDKDLSQYASTQSSRSSFGCGGDACEVSVACRGCPATSLELSVAETEKRKERVNVEDDPEDGKEGESGQERRRSKSNRTQTRDSFMKTPVRNRSTERERLWNLSAYISSSPDDPENNSLFWDNGSPPPSSASVAQLSFDRRGYHHASSLSAVCSIGTASPGLDSSTSSMSSTTRNWDKSVATIKMSSGSSRSQSPNHTKTESETALNNAFGNIVASSLFSSYSLSSKADIEPSPKNKEYPSQQGNSVPLESADSACSPSKTHLSSSLRCPSFHFRPLCNDVAAESDSSFLPPSSCGLTPGVTPRSTANRSNGLNTARSTCNSTTTSSTGCVGEGGTEIIGSSISQCRMIKRKVPPPPVQAKASATAGHSFPSGRGSGGDAGGGANVATTTATPQPEGKPQEAPSISVFPQGEQMKSTIFEPGRPYWNSGCDPHRRDRQQSQPQVLVTPSAPVSPYIEGGFAESFSLPLGGSYSTLNSFLTPQMNAGLFPSIVSMSSPIPTGAAGVTNMYSNPAILNLISTTPYYPSLSSPYALSIATNPALTPVTVHYSREAREIFGMRNVNNDGNILGGSGPSTTPSDLPVSFVHLPPAPSGAPAVCLPPPSTAPAGSFRNLATTATSHCSSQISSTAAVSSTSTSSSLSPFPATTTAGVAGAGAGAALDFSFEQKSNTNLFVSHLPMEVDDRQLRNAFTPFGDVVAVAVMRNIFTTYSKGSGFVRFRTHEEASKAKEALNGRNVLDIFPELSPDGKLATASHPPSPATTTTTTTPPSFSPNKDIFNAADSASAQVGVERGEEGNLNFTHCVTATEKLTSPISPPGRKGAGVGGGGAAITPILKVVWASAQHDKNAVLVDPLEVRKLFIRNIPPSATVKDVRDVFSPFGPVLSVSLHKDTMTRNTRPLSPSLPPAGTGKTYTGVGNSSPPGTDRAGKSYSNSVPPHNPLANGSDNSFPSAAALPGAPPSPYSLPPSSFHRQIGFVTFAKPGVAVKAAEAVHNTKAFRDCGDVAVLVKIATEHPQDFRKTRDGYAVPSLGAPPYNSFRHRRAPERNAPQIRYGS